MTSTDGFTMTVTLPDMSHAIGDVNFFKPFFEWVASHKAPMENEIKKLLQDYGRDGHRNRKGVHYKNQTGRLRKSTKSEGSFGSDLKQSINLYVDLSQAPYGEWIITGKRNTKNGLVTWNGGKGDPFIDEAFDALMPKINEIIINFFNEATMEFNRRQ